MKCLDCKTEFDYPNLDEQCKKHPGKHVVERKLYVYAGSTNIANLRDRRFYSPMVQLKADSTRITEDGTTVRTPLLEVRFADARYETSDPEEQYHLENTASKKFPIIWGENAEATWRANQLTPDQQAAISKAELADMQRQIKEGNELLAKVKASKAPQTVNA